MRRTRNIVWSLVVVMIATLGAACATSGAPSIAQLKTNPGRYVDRTVTVEGVVTTSWGLPFVSYKVYRVSDGSDEMLVVSDDSRVPAKGARVRVRGEVEEFALIGGRSFGLHLKEKGLKYL